MTILSRKTILGCGTAILVLTLATGALAQQRRFDVPAQDATQAVPEFARQAGLQIIAPGSQLRGIRTQAVRGDHDVRAALTAMLRGTGLIVASDNGSVITLRRTASIPQGRQTPDLEAVVEVDEIVVTGTNIRGVAPVGSQLIAIGRSEIEATGFATTPQLIQSLPQNSGLGANEASFSRSTIQNANVNSTGGTGVNLRGLGPLSTLVLINGRRMAPSGSGTFSDVGVIPLGAVERVEVVPDGASAIYGSDAIGGVVNFVLRRNFDGAETSVRYGGADGFEQIQVGQIAGRTWSGGSALLSYEFERRGSLAAEDRDYFTQDLRAFGGGDYRTSFANPGTIIDGGVPYGIPAGQDGTALTAADLIPGQINLQDQNRGTTILPERVQHSVMGAVRQEATSWLSLFAEGYYANREVEQSIAAAGSTLNVPASNPFFVSPTGASAVRVQYSFLDDLGPTSYANSVENYNLTLGGEALLAGGWRARLHGSHGVDNQTTRLENIVNSARLDLALADPDPVTAFNPFGDGSHTHPETLNAIRGYNNGGTRYAVDSVNLTADGALFVLPGGEVRLAIGAEHRKETLKTVSEAYQSALTPIRYIDRFGRDVDAVYAELHLPIVGESNRRRGVHRLEVSLAGRFEDYSDFGSTANPKLGLTWEPSPDIRFRGSWGESFQAPSLRQLTSGSAAYVLYPLPDPQSSTGQTVTLIYSAPGNPDLKPQTATTWSLGADIHPRFWPGFTASVSYFDINYDGLIGSIGSNLFNALALEQIYGPLIKRNPDAAFIQAVYDSGFLIGAPVSPGMVGAFVNAAPTNLGMLKQQGLDLSASQSFNTEAGHFRLQASVTWMLGYDVSQTPTAPLIDMLDTLNNPVDLRARAGGTWSRGPLSGALFANYVDGYRNNGVTPAQKVDAWTTIDLQFAYELSDHVTLSVQAQNVFDEDPPFLDNANYGYDPSAASAIGRYLSLHLRKRW